MRAKKLTIAALALSAGLSLTACQGGEDSKASAHTSGSSSASSSSSSSSSSASGGNSGGGSASDDGSVTTGGGTGGGHVAAKKAAQGSGKGQITTGTCKTSNLAFSASHGMAEGDMLVSLKNKGDACTLKGFPGVDLKSEQASRPLSAKRSDKAAPVVNLQSGETTRFTLHTPPNNSGGTGAKIDRMVVTPPNETHSKNLSVSIDFPVEEGADQKVFVDPVGTGKQ